MTRLKDKYISEVAPALQEKFKYSSPMQIPKVDKIVLNMGVKVNRSLQAQRGHEDRMQGYFERR